jgi:hypothetical protein
MNVRYGHSLQNGGLGRITQSFCEISCPYPILPSGFPLRYTSVERAPWRHRPSRGVKYNTIYVPARVRDRFHGQC